MSGKNKTAVSMIAGLAVVTAAAGVLLVRFGADHIATGIGGGIAVAYLGLLTYYLLVPRPGGRVKNFFRGYLPGALLRYVIMIGAFCAVVFRLRINAVGVLVGTFAGMMTATIISLFKMRRTPSRPPEE